MYDVTTAAAPCCAALVRHVATVVGSPPPSQICTLAPSLASAWDIAVPMPDKESTALVIGTYQTVLPFNDAGCFTVGTVASVTLPEYLATCAFANARPAFCDSPDAPDDVTPINIEPNATADAVAMVAMRRPFFKRRVSVIMFPPSRLNGLLLQPADCLHNWEVDSFEALCFSPDGLPPVLRTNGLRTWVFPSRVQVSMFPLTKWRHPQRAIAGRQFDATSSTGINIPGGLWWSASVGRCPQIELLV